MGPALAHTAPLELVWVCESDRADSNSLQRAALFGLRNLKVGNTSGLLTPHIPSLNIWSQVESDSRDRNLSCNLNELLLHLG